jgi:hypothetical protein
MANAETYLGQGAAQFPDRELPGDVGGAEMGVVQRAAAPGQFQARLPAELANPHRDDFFRTLLPLKEIEQPLQLRGGVGPRCYFDNVCA